MRHFTSGMPALHNSACELLSGSHDRARPVELRLLRHWRVFRRGRPVTQGAGSSFALASSMATASAETLVRRTRCVQFFSTRPRQWVAFDTVKQQFPKPWIIATRCACVCILCGTCRVCADITGEVRHCAFLTHLHQVSGTHDPDDGDVGCHFRRCLSVGMSREDQHRSLHARPPSSREVKSFIRSVRAGATYFGQFRLSPT